MTQLTHRKHGLLFHLHLNDRQCTHKFIQIHKNAYFQKNGLSINDDTIEKNAYFQKMAYPLTVDTIEKNAYFQKNGLSIKR